MMYLTVTTYLTITLITMLGSRTVITQAGSKQIEAPKPSRVVKDQVLASTEKPAIQIQFDKAFKYIGAQSFILYGVATAEQHFFVDADENKQIHRLYWIQFEGYLPSNTHTYRYQSKKKGSLGQFEFFADAAARKSGAASRPDSDSAKFLQFIKDKGYRMAEGDFLSQRLVHLVDEKKRDELMIIYLESLKPMQLTAADLAPTGKAAAQWEGISEKLLQRALKGMELVKE